MSAPQTISQEPSKARYVEDDTAHSLPIAIGTVLLAALENKGPDSDFGKGVIAFARSMAVIYDIPWADMTTRLLEDQSSSA